MDRREPDDGGQVGAAHVAVPEPMLRRGARAFSAWAGAATLIGALVVAAVLVGQQLADRRTGGVVASPTPAAPPSLAPSPSPTNSPSPTVTPTPSAPPLLVSFESQVLGYRIQLPEGFRRSDCLSGVSAGDGPWRPWLGGDTFTLLSSQQERTLDRGHVARGGRVAMWTFSVSLYDAGGMSALELAERGGCPACDRNTATQAGERIESVLLAGQEAVRSVFGGESRRYVVRVGDRLYKVELYFEPGLGGARPDVVPVGILDLVAGTFRTSQPPPIATPTPQPQSPPAAARVAADQLAGALEASDPDRLAALITPRCWLETWFAQAGPIGRAVEPYVAELRTRFADGLRIRVDRTVQVANEDGPGGLRLFVRSDWNESGRSTRVDLYLGEIDSRWYWAGAQHYVPDP